MTWVNTPWAIDGALHPAALARLGNYVSLGGAEGIAQVPDLKVLPLVSPGNGIRIVSGGAAVLNRYQTSPDQTYLVYTPTGEILGSGDMPPSSPSARSHLVCVVVGDPEFDQAGHPFMLNTDPPAGTENTFQYVRTFVIPNVPSTTTRFEELGLHYPAYALARLDMPGSTTTVQAAYIKDLREMARPRTKDVSWHVAVSATDSLDTGVGVYEYFPDQSAKGVYVPSWASYVYTDGYVEGLRITADTNAKFRIGSMTEGIYSTDSHLAHAWQSGITNRRSVQIGGPIYIPPASRGKMVTFQISAAPVEGLGTSIVTDTWTTAQVNLRFAEVAD